MEHYLKEAKENLDSKLGSIEYLKAKIADKTLAKWEIKEYENTLIEALNDLEDAKVRYENCVTLSNS